MKTVYFSLLWLVSIFPCGQILVLCLIVFFFTNSMAAGATVSINNDLKSVLIVTDTNAIQLQPWSPGTIRVEAAPGKNIPHKKGIENVAVIGTPDATAWVVTDDSDKVELKSDRLSASVDKVTGLVSFFTPDGTLLLRQSAWAFQPTDNAARDGLQVEASFDRSPGEHFYGGGVLGDELRSPTTDIQLANYAVTFRIPILYSSKGYAIFWQNPSWGRLKLTQNKMTWHSSAGDVADYFVFAGPHADDTVAEYRHLTGAAPLFPRWAYGFWFSKNKFTSQNEILGAARNFRDHQFPVDLIVQDWYYWRPSNSPHEWDGWGSDQFVTDRYPDVKGMIDQLHDDFHLHFMTVVWPRLDDQGENSKELDAIHGIFPHMHVNQWDQGSSFYDAYNARVRDIYGRQVMENLLPIGVDAFWMDATQPESGNGEFRKFDSLEGPVSRIEDTYPFYLTQTLYNAQRKATSDQKRVVLLPCSIYPGEQRNGAAIWTSDVHQDWASLKWQMQGLQNISITGYPYITTDIGGYGPTSESDQELFVRWFEWGTFCPIYRVHGVDRPFPWEYGDAEPILQKFDRLRYRLLPYIYSQAGQVTLNSGTILRPLVMDFQDDAKALDTWDEFMFGPSILVCPVYQTSRENIGTVPQFYDNDGHAGSVTAIYIKGDGNQVVAKKDLREGLQFTEGAQGNQQGQSSIRIQGTYTPSIDGALAFEVSEPHAAGYPTTASINASPTPPVTPDTDSRFPQFPFTAVTGEPVKFSIETKMRDPVFRVVRDLPLYRNVYLPETQDWYDFWTGKRTTGGQTLKVEAPLERIPIYVRAGSIVPMGAELQYAAEKPADPTELRVYRGKDATFTLYEDEGDSYNYEKGAYTIIPISWNDSTQTLSIGQRKGSFLGMLTNRTFNIVWVSSGHGAGVTSTAASDVTVKYSGQALNISAKN
jgi:alpha-D-xyloside xylohydrolase